MPLPVAEIIGAGTALAVAGGNAYMQGRTNRKGRAQNQYFFDRQRENSLSDWHMQNAYNSPAAQKQRLKDAHLNPALVYGQGSTGSNASSVHETEYRDTTQQAPQIDPGIIGKVQEVYNAKLQRSILQQNLANEMEKNALIKAQTLDNIASADSKTTGTARAKIDLAIESLLQEDKTFSERSRYQKQSSDAEISALDLQQKEKFQNLSQTEQQKRIDLLEQQIKNAGQENLINSVQEKLAKQGINPKSGGWFTEYWQQLRLFFKSL